MSAAAVVLLCSVATASAQDELKAEARRAAATTASKAPANEAPVGVAGLGGAEKGSAFQAVLEATADDKTATVQAGWKDGTSTYTLTFKGPVGGKSKEAVPLTLDGLGNGARVELAANHLAWRAPTQAERDEAKAMCAKLLPGQGCDSNKLAKADADRMDRLLHASDVPWMAGVTGSLSMASYTWLQGTTFTEQTRKYVDWSLGAQAGVFTPQLGFLIASVSARQESKAGADAVSLCRPVAGTDATACSNAVLKMPGSAATAVASVQVRRGLRGDVAITPQVQYDMRKKVSAVNVPVFFLKDAKGAPIGGVRGAWRSDTHAVVVSLFIGAAFGLTP